MPGEYSLGNESILKIYHRIFESGYGNCLPPVIVAKSDVKIENLEPGLEFIEVIQFIIDCEHEGEEPKKLGPKGEDSGYRYPITGDFDMLIEIGQKKDSMKE